MSKAIVKLSYKNLKIIKQALQLYVKRPGVGVKDSVDENKLLDYLTLCLQDLIE